jgi:hypothetical protein
MNRVTPAARSRDPGDGEDPAADATQTNGRTADGIRSHIFIDGVLHCVGDLLLGDAPFSVVDDNVLSVVRVPADATICHSGD